MLGNDTSTTSLVHFFIFLQLPVVSLLTYFSFQAAQTPLNLQPFKFIRWGWLCNIIYLVLSGVLSEADSKIFFYGLSHNLSHLWFSYYKIIIHFFDLLGCYFIIRGSRNFYKKKNWLNKVIPYNPIFLIAGFVFVYIVTVLNTFSVAKFEVFQLLLYGFVTFSSYICLSEYFKTFHAKYRNIKSLYWGSIIFAFIQFLVLLYLFEDISHFWIDLSGFSLGFLSKCIIAYGLHELFLIYMKHSIDYETEKEQTNKLFLFLGKT
ncbi:MAG: hypothetical protein ACKV1O_08540, partial [Saprospiraceae bacterium]